MWPGTTRLMISFQSSFLFKRSSEESNIRPFCSHDQHANRSAMRTNQIIIENWDDWRRVWTISWNRRVGLNKTKRRHRVRAQHKVLIKLNRSLIGYSNSIDYITRSSGLSAVQCQNYKAKIDAVVQDKLKRVRTNRRGNNFLVDVQLEIRPFQNITSQVNSWRELYTKTVFTSTKNKQNNSDSTFCLKLYLTGNLHFHFLPTWHRIATR
jgi:hypothetical protein